MSSLSFRRFCCFAVVLCHAALFLNQRAFAQETCPGAEPSPGSVPTANASDVEILRAFQERYYADRGGYADWRRNEFNGGVTFHSTWPNPTWPAEGDYTQSQLDEIITNIFYYLKRYSAGGVWPLFYLEDANVDGAKNWGEIRKKVIRIVHTVETLTGDQTRGMVADVLRRQRILVTPLVANDLKVKEQSTIKSDVPATPPNPATVGASAAWFAADTWDTPAPTTGFGWKFTAIHVGWSSFRTGYTVHRFKCGVASRFSGCGFTPVLSITPVDPSGWELASDWDNVVTVLESKGFPLRQAQAYFKYNGTNLDPGNLYSLCAASCKVSSGFSTLFENLDVRQFSFALVYPQFKYLTGGGGGANGSCSSCAAGSSSVWLNSVNVSIPLGKTQLGKAMASLKLESPHVSTQLFEPQALQAYLAPGFTMVPDSGGAPRQIYSDAVIADVSLRGGGDGFEVAIYDRPAMSTPDSMTGLLSVGSLTPVATHKFINAQATGGPYPAGQGQLRYERVHGSVTDSYTFKSEPQSGNGTPLVTLIQPGNHKTESVRTTWTVNAGGVRENVDTETRITYNVSGTTVIGKEVRTYRWGTNGRLLEQVVIDPDGAALTTTCTYASDDPKRVSQIVRPDGSWDQYTYDGMRRVTKHRSGKLDTLLTCTDAECRVVTTAYPDVLGSGLTRTVTTDTNVEVARTYRKETTDGYQDIVCTVAGAAFNASTNLVTTTKWYTTGWFQRQPKVVTAPDGTISTYAYTISPTGAEPADADALSTVVETGQPNGAGDTVVDGTRQTTMINREGNLIFETTEDIVSSQSLSFQLASSVDDHGRPVAWDYLDGSEEILNYDCCGLSSRTDRQGLTTNYTRDLIVSRVPAGGGTAVNGLESSTFQSVSYIDDMGSPQTGNLKYIQREEGLTSRTFRQGADSSLIETGRTVRDNAGRVVSSRDALGNVTTFSESYVPQGSPPAMGPDTRPRHLVRTTTLPDSSTRIEEYYQDGSLLSITGTAVHGQRFEYGADSDGTWTKVILLLANGSNSSEWSKSWTDLAGRAWKTTTSAGATTTRYFNAAGQLWKSVDADGVIMLSEYDARGRMKRTVLDVDRDNTVDLAGPDRIASTIPTVGTHSSANVVISTSTVWTASDTGSTGSEVAKTEVLTTGLESWSTAAGLTTHTVRTLGSAGAWTETTTAPDNTQSIRTYAGGRLASTAQKDTAGTVISSSSVLYDAHGRIYSTTDPRSGVTLYTYYDDDTVETVTTPDPDSAGPLSPQVTTTTYTNRGQTDVVTLPDGTTQDRDYYPTGEVEEVTGTAAPAVAYTYDYAGRTLTLTTQPGTGAAAATTWTYHSTSGLLASKIHAAGSGTESFTWTAGGRALTKVNARGTTIGYFYGSGTSGVVAGSGNLTDVTYTDSTPAITYTFDRLGRMTTAVSGGITRTIDLTLHGQQESEAWTGGPLDGLTADPGFDSLRRPNALAVTGSGGTVPSQSFTYDTLTGELSTISSGTATATYAYRTGTRQIASVTFAESSTTRLTQTRAYDDLHRLTGVTSQTPGPVDLAASSYTLDDAGRRSSTLLADGTWWKYTYDDHGQVLSAERRRMTGSTPNISDPAVPGQQFAYGYDGLGNRVAAIQGGAVTDDVEFDYTPTTANQYSAITHTRTGIVTGLADASATVTVNSNAAARSGPWWAQSESTSTGSSAAWLDFSIDATLGGSTDHADTQLLVPPSSVSPAYDADGNLTDDGLRTFTWDAENRLLQVTTKDTLLPVGAAMYRVSYTYDDAGRRIAQTVETRTSSSGSYVLASRRCFLYEGWSCLAEYDYTPSGGGATRTLFRTQVWGADFGGGGAGGLLLIRRHTGSLTGTHFATHDGNGNITALVNAATGTESARYEYDPFGNLLRTTGPFAAENPYRFSTQFTDEVTGLLYYGYRHFDPVHGRWLSRDPIGEAGGINLYGFVGNGGINGIDILGLEGDHTQAVTDEIERQTHPEVVKAAIFFSDAEHEYNAALNSERARTDWWSKHALETTRALEAERTKARAALISAMDQAGLLPKQNCPCPTGINMWTGRVELDSSLLWSPSQSPDYTTTEIPDSIMKLGADFASKLRGAWQKDFKSDAPILFAAWHIIQDKKIQFLLALTPMGRGCRVGAVPVKGTPLRLPGNGFSIWTHPERALPPYTGGPTSGVIVPLTPPGLPVYLSSGSRTGARFPFSQADGHVETLAALQMEQRGIQEATLFHNNPKGTCGNCDYFTPTFLQPSSTLHIVPPPGSAGPTPRWITFPKSYTGNSASPYPQ